ncbi:hypothetical protein VMF7928_00346 [Vibrio marisflavi CECT 7928]|uniref:Uncharacterized protein n=1 Tax=Vibrio marisflavi CECT 7928 TaxID=634439 RepID=A0ABM8ZZ75_9VIBR|nr:hypothetical protein VMF7928_00346 [Vibrio marisflavi CECT 7928]
MASKNATIDTFKYIPKAILGSKVEILEPVKKLPKKWQL